MHIHTKELPDLLLFGCVLSHQKACYIDPVPLRAAQLVGELFVSACQLAASLTILCERLVRDL